MLHTHLERERSFGAVRVLAQMLASEDKSEGIKAFGAYKDLMFPWQAGEDEAEKKRALDMMSAELARGPLAVAPVPGMSRKGGPAVQKVDAPLLQLRPPTEPTYGRKFREESDEP